MGARAQSELYQSTKMKINLLTVGRLKEKYLVDAVNEYLKRLKPFASVEIREVPEQKTIEDEGERLLSLIQKDSWVCVLDVGGVELSSEKFASRLETLMVEGKSQWTFIIGGAFGISERLRSTADFRLSLSKMTFTHQMTRVILVEQIYRAFKIIRGEKYHW